MILKKIIHKAAQAFRLAQAADKKLSTGIAAALAQAGFSAAAATYALRRFAEALKPEPLSHLTNNWRKMHGLPMRRKPAAFRRRRKGNGTGKQSK